MFNLILLRISALNVLKQDAFLLNIFMINIRAINFNTNRRIIYTKKFLNVIGAFCLKSWASFAVLEYLL